MKYFTGIDVSLRFVSICVVDEAGVCSTKARSPLRWISSWRRSAASAPRSGRSVSRPAPSRSI